MKKQFIIGIALLAISGTMHAGSDSFWTGMGIGAATTFVGSKIAHAHSCSHPRYVEVHTVQHDDSASLRQEIRILERENSQLEQENAQLHKELTQERTASRKEKKELQATIRDLQEKIGTLEETTQELRNTIKKSKKDN